MKRQLLFLFMLFCAAGVAAQNNNPVTVTFDRSQKGDVTFWAENSSYTPHTVTISFTKLSNTSSFVEGSPTDILVGHGKRQLVTLRPSVEGRYVGFSFRTLAKKGDSRAQTDTNYVYLLPVAVGKPVLTNRMISLEALLRRSESKRVTGLSFKTNAGDTIMAARAGLVTEVEDQSASTTEKKTYNATENFVEVYHKDGTFGRYKLFQNGGIFVQPGDEVIPGQPIGIIGGDNYKRGSHLRFTVYSPAFEYRAFVPSFYLGEGKIGKPEDRQLYVSEHPQEIIMQEMSKKEKKKYLRK